MTLPTLTTTEEKLVGWYGIETPNVHARRDGYAYQWAYSTRQLVQVDTIVIHSAESVADVDGSDSGAENVAQYMTNNTRKVSWHATSDSDSVVWSCPWEWTAFHAGSSNNRRSWGIEQAFQAGKYHSQPRVWRLEMLNNTAQAVACAALFFGIPVRHVRSKTGLPGIIGHGTTPEVNGLTPASNRSDPGWRNDDWEHFIKLVKFWYGRNPVALGFEGARVRECQTDINARHNAGLVVDGLFGPATQRAVLRDQKSRGAKLTGVWHSANPTKPAPTPAPPTPTPVPVPPKLPAAVVSILEDAVVAGNQQLARLNEALDHR